MSRSCKLLLVTETEKQSILREHGINEAQFEDNLNHLLDWKDKTTLPKEDICRNKLIVFLCNGKMSLERTKRSIEGYYKIRTIYSYFFDQMVVTSDDYKDSKNLVKIGMVPKLTPDLCRITVMKPTDPYGEANNGLLYFLRSLMLAEIRLMCGDCFYSNIIIFDVKEVQLKNLVKCTPSVTQKLTNFVKATNLRIKNIHFVNTSPLMEHVMMLVKSVMPSKFMNKMCLHKNAESLYEYIPKEYLPSDYNGHQPSIDQLNEKWTEEIEQRKEDFEKLLQVKASDYIKMAMDEKEIFGLGSDGSFKKILID